MDGIVEQTKARRAYLALKDRIRAGSLRPGARFPGEPTLAAEFGVSRVTIRRALDQLQLEGLIERRAGSGTYLREETNDHPIVADLSNALTQLVAMGRRTGVRLLAFGYGTPPAGVAAALRLPAGARTQHSVRVRLIDGKPFSYLTTHVPESIGITYSEADLAAQPLLDLLERAGIETDRASQSLSATLAGPETAAALGVDLGAPLLHLTRVVYDPAGRGVEHLEALYRPDRYRFQMDLVRIGFRGERRWHPAQTSENGPVSP